MTKRDDEPDTFDERWHLESWPQFGQAHEADAADGAVPTQHPDDGWPARLMTFNP